MHVQQMQDQVLCKCLLNVQERFMIYLSVIIRVEQMINVYELNMQICKIENTIIITLTCRKTVLVILILATFMIYHLLPHLLVKWQVRNYIFPLSSELKTSRSLVDIFIISTWLKYIYISHIPSSKKLYNKDVNSYHIYTHLNYYNVYLFNRGNAQEFGQNVFLRF